MTAAASPPGPGFATSGFFALRTPALPFETLLEWASGLTAADAIGDPALLEAALAADRALLRARLAGLIAAPEVREALFLASPDLFEAIPAWRADPDGEKGQRAERTLVKYLYRMAGRPTPFGLFAANSIGRLGDTTHLVLGPKESRRRHSRLDMDYLQSLADSIGQDPGRRAALVHRPNSSLYKSGSGWRLVEASAAGTERSYRLVAVEDSDPIRTALARAARGARLGEVASAVVDDEVSPEEAAAFAAELADAQILVPDVGLRVTGPEPAASMASFLAGDRATADVASALSHACAELAEIDGSGPGADPARYRRIQARLSTLPVAPDLRRLFQVDLVGTAPEATLGGPVLLEIEQAVTVMQRLIRPTGRVLADFRDAFLERYERREVPLVEALDEEAGIGFPAHRDDGAEAEPLVRNVPFSPLGGETTRWGPRERFVLARIQDVARAGSTEIVLTARDVDRIAPEPPLPLPGAFAVVARVGAGSMESLARGDFQVAVVGIDGPPGACVLGRFCHADPDLRRLVEAHVREEEALDPQALFAEVVHLPENRVGNVLLRPVLRRYEIPYLGFSGAPEDYQIPVTDLLVSVVGEEVRLRSGRTGRRVHPRLTTAHNYTHESLGVYRFLGELQTQGVAVGRAWDWAPFRGAPFLPRVRFGNIVLAPARWTVFREEIERLERTRGAARFAEVQRLRKDRGLPRIVLLADGDNELPFDLEAALSAEAFVHSVKGREDAELVEMLPGPDQLVASGPEGRYVHELVIPFVRTGPSAAPSPPPSRPVDSSAHPRPVRRSFPPGSDWLTAKLYAGVATSDRLLLGSVVPLARQAIESGAADRWFFLRYADPRHHLRVRLHGEPGRLRDEVLPAITALAREGAEAAPWKIQLDTYERELERYGGPDAIDAVERLFFADSEAVVDLLELLEEGEAGREERWRLALAVVDSLLRDLGLDLADCRREAARARDTFASELGVSVQTRRALGERFRAEAGALGALLGPDRAPDSPLAPGFEVLDRRSARFAGILDELKALEETGRMTRPVASLAGSLCHMHLNRLLRAAHRRQEYVVWDFLARLYASRAARA